MPETPRVINRVTQALDALLDDWVAGRIHTPDLSRAAIQAMRRPSSSMIEAGIRYADDTSEYGMQRGAAEALALGLFDAMIDAALTETPDA